MNSSTETFQSDRFIATSEKLPEPDRPVIVVTPKFRCLAIHSRDGVWRYEANGDRLETTVLAWSALLI